MCKLHIQRQQSSFIKKNINESLLPWNLDSCCWKNKKLMKGQKIAILRETKEETNLDLNNLFFVKNHNLNDDEYWIYMSKIIQYEISLNHENDHFDFFEKNNLPENLWSFFKTEINNI